MNVFWFRRDLRLHDNTALHAALEAGQVQPIFIFDTNILEHLPRDDARVTFIHDRLQVLNDQLAQYGTAVRTFHGDPMEVWRALLREGGVDAVFCNRDYEPYARERDRSLSTLLALKRIPLHAFKDQVIFEKDEVVKQDGQPYTVFTPYKQRWLKVFQGAESLESQHLFSRFVPCTEPIISLKNLGFDRSSRSARSLRFEGMEGYDHWRDFPAKDHTSHLSTHLRFGTVSVRECVQTASVLNETLLSELIWREFFMQILFHYPHVVTDNFRSKYNGIRWQNNEADFQAWCRGKTGYPFVDAGMRELNETGYMHNRVRMITSGFLVKHLLVDWRWGEAYFAEKLLDYDLAANNGNWQWAAGTGCDAAPYFRIFNPTEQMKRFDPDLVYTRRWVKDLGEPSYPKPIVEHSFARERCLAVYKAALS